MFVTEEELFISITFVCARIIKYDLKLLIFYSSNETVL